MALTDPTTLFATSLKHVWKGVNYITQDTDVLINLVAGMQKQKIGGQVLPMVGTPQGLSLSTDADGKEGWYWTKRLLYKYNQRFQGLNIRDTLGDPTDEAETQIKLSMKTSAMPVEIEWEVSQGSGAGGLDEGGSIWEDRTASIDMIWPLRFGSMFRGDGTGTQAVARVGSTASKTLYVYDTADLHVSAGAYVDIIDGSGVEQAGDVLIDAVDLVNHKITFNAVQTVTAGWRLVPANSYNKFAPGLQAYISDGSPIGSTTVGEYYVGLGNASWGGVNSTTVPDHTTLIRRANDDGDGAAGQLRHWNAKKLELVMQLRNDTYGPLYPVNYLWMRPDTFLYMREHSDEFYKAIEYINKPDGASQSYAFGYEGQPVYRHPALAGGQAAILIDPKAWAHCVVGLAMYPETLGIRWAKPPHFVGDTDSADVLRALQNQVNYNGKFVYRGTLACLWGTVGSWRNRFWVFADAYGGYNEPWNRPA